MASESLEQRALAAIRFLDEETRLPVKGPVKVEGTGVKLVRNLSGFHVITDAPGFSTYAASFDLPQVPPSPASFTLTATDPSRTYLARRFTVQLPRDPAPGPDESLPANSVFKPVDVVLYPSPVARPSAGSAVVRLRVEDTNGKPLPYALVQLTLATPAIQRRGLCDERGEALVLMPGIPIADWSDPEATTDFDVTVRAAWTADAPPPNPDALAAAMQDVTGTIEVAAGTETTKTIQLGWIEL